MLIAVLVFLLVFSVVVLAHELGHYYFAIKAGARVEEFGFGLPPRIWGRRRGDTIYSLNLIPFGGFIRLYGEDDSFIKDKKSFISKKPLQKLSIVAGGVLMNFVLGFVVMMIGFWLGMPPLASPAERYVSEASRSETRALVVATVKDSVAAKAGLLAGDYILASGDQKFNDPAVFKDFIQHRAGKSTPVLVKRQRQELTLEMTPVKGKSGLAEVGVLLDRSVDKVHYIWWQVPGIALQETLKVIWLVVVSIASLIYKIFATASLPAEISGPVGIAKITIDMVKLGLLRVLQFIIFLSINLGVINVVPFPGLDGGRLVFVAIEWLRRGKRVSGQIESAINTVGFVLLVALITVITYKDILKLI